MSTEADPPAARALALATLTGACLVALGLATDQASADSTARVQAGTPGDGSDTVDGQSGKDALAFNGSNIGEDIHVAANVDLASFTGDGDGAVDTVVVNGSDRAERVRVTRAGPQVLTTGLAAQTTIAGSEPTLDTLRVNTLGGRDDVQVAPDVSALITPVVDLGAGQ
jgi:hypothetical protein